MKQGLYYLGDFANYHIFLIHFNFLKLCIPIPENGIIGRNMLHC
jgi:hypothetical protein